MPAPRNRDRQNILLVVLFLADGHQQLLIFFVVEQREQAIDLLGPFDRFVPIGELAVSLRGRDSQSQSSGLRLGGLWRIFARATPLVEARRMTRDARRPAPVLVKSTTSESSPFQVEK